jgi:hypothetical protein
METQVKWFDLSRFSAALKVVPNSPLRGIAMTCLDVKDEDAFVKHVQGPVPDSADVSAFREFRARGLAWWDQMRELGFNSQAEHYDQTTESRGRAFRLYSDRTKFTLGDIQRIVPGLTADDYKTMALSEIVHQPAVNPEIAEGWKKFAEQVLANEAVDVWAPKVNPFDKPWADAKPIDEVWIENARGNRSPLLDGDPVSRWFGGELRRARYRENALVTFYADQESALAAGLQAGQIEEVTLPYALPLWVEKSGRIVALKDIRHVPEILALPPQNYFRTTLESSNGIAVNVLRESRSVEAIYREEAQKWRDWKESDGEIDREVLNESLRRVVESDAAFCQRFPNASSDIIKLTEGQWRMSGAAPSMKPLAGWGEAEFRNLLSASKRFVRDDSVDDIFEVMNALDTRLRAQDAGRAKVAAKEALRRVAETVQTPTDESTVEKVRHEDAGEKIGGARKDFYRHAITTDDLEGMNDYERKSLVVKKNVWPPLDYEAMREAGVTPQAAVAIKYLKDSLNVEPEKSKHRMRGDNPEAEYIKAVGAVRDAMADVKTLDEFAKACHKLYEMGRGNTGYITGGSEFQVGIGSDASRLLHGSENTLGWGENIRKEACVPYKIKLEVDKRVKEDAEWNYLIKPKREKSDADKEADSERAEQERELHRPHLDLVERNGGEEWRAGRDIVAQDLMDHFGFRAIEFGKWLPQDERQTVLNMAFDSLCDLAAALDLPPKGISLNGDLAVAFGSRGRGGKNAALAHFEPGRDVINLTRMKGAGTLAHEWFHALDWHLGERQAYLTTAAKARGVDDPMPKLVKAMTHRASAPEDLAERSRNDAEKHKGYALSWCYQSKPETVAVIKTAFDEYFEKAKAKFYELASQRFSTLSEHERKLSNNARALGSGGAVSLNEQSDLCDEITKAVRNICRSDGQKMGSKAAGAVEGNAGAMLRHMARWMTIEAARDLGVTLDDRFLGGDNAVETGYFKQAKALDEKRSSPYWATEVELFARAGAQYVYYELAERGVRSDYLVYGADEERYMKHSIGNPNPVGMDRLALREHFGALVEDYRIRLLQTMEVETPEP